MLIEHLVDQSEVDGLADLRVGDLDAFCQAARRAFDESAAFRDRSRQRVVALQAGDPQTLPRKNPVLRADPAVRRSRLVLCGLTARTIHMGLDILGIEAPDVM